MTEERHAVPYQAIACTGGLPPRRGRLTLPFDGDHPDVTVHGFWLAFPQHTTYLVVETDDIAHLQAFLKPGAGVTLCEITPVSDTPVAPNN